MSFVMEKLKESHSEMFFAPNWIQIAINQSIKNKIKIVDCVQYILYSI